MTFNGHQVRFNPVGALIDFGWLCLVGFGKAYGISADGLDTDGEKFKLYNVMHGLHDDGYVGEFIDITYLGKEYNRGEPPSAQPLSASLILSASLCLSLPLSHSLIPSLSSLSSLSSLTQLS